DTDMRLNYMKANYLRASQLISAGSFRAAVPYLKAAAYYSDKRETFNQLSRYWLAESYYRSGDTDQALSLFRDLYNINALYGEPESYLLPYNMAWCHFRKSDYKSAEKWFTEYLGGRSVVWRKEALTRRGDCLFMQKMYKEAGDAYSQVLEDYFDVNDIYPYYQAGMAKGLCGDDAGKCRLLENVLKASPKSSFYPDAVFELGKVYVRLGNNDKAEETFAGLTRTGKDSTFVARALIELGMIARNGSRPQEAIAYYKRVVEQMPLSGYAEDALVALESVYQSMNDPDSYLAYIERIGKGSMKTEDEKEMMIFNAAEQIFLSEDYGKAVVSLESFMKRYPSSPLLPKAQFYMAESFKDLDQPEKACDWYEKVMKTGQGSYLELSVLNFSNLSYKLQRFEDAFSGYSMLLETAVLENNRHIARLGMMRSAYGGRDYAKAADCASGVLEDAKTTGDTKTEAMFILAKSYLATSRRDGAFEILRTLAKDPSTPQGAEAAYMLAQDSYDRGDFTGAENLVYDFSDSGTGQTYWLARAFIVLGDSFVERDNYEQAKATYESILNGYNPETPDDIADTVTSRLEKLAELQDHAMMQM
ncbi:MAG: tetratricopeptide repeat protein, partial [Candidatus Cryptobacteroides sp.]